MSFEKGISPRRVLTWIGYEINADKLIIKIPKDKLSDIIEECNKWKVGNLATRKEVQRLAGKLNFIPR